ncbi:hypothetical protein ABUW04_19150 [Streptacidiphilus sp. N1-10]|uniref:Uncharacterized protein n=1 Tax=Streptacidiphilus jeojiensis TaxID=3229225 RepID=A0ABV6XQ64_9ACTN
MARFTIENNRTEPMEIIFEPSAVEITLEVNKGVLIEWEGDEIGEIVLTQDYVVVGSPAGGGMRAWDDDGDEILGVL